MLCSQATNCDSLAVLGAFILAFALQDLGSLDGSGDLTGVSLVSFMLNAVTCAAGLSSVLLLTFTSIKLRRLVAKSMYYFGTFGQDVGVDELVPMHGDRSALLATLRSFASNNSVGEVRLHARAWYYTPDNGPGLCGYVHFRSGVNALLLELLAYVLTLALRAYTFLPLSTALSATAVLILAPAYALWQLLQTGALSDLA